MEPYKFDLVHLTLDSEDNTSATFVLEIGISLPEGEEKLREDDPAIQPRVGASIISE